MLVELQGHNYKEEIEELVRLFCPPADSGDNFEGDLIPDSKTNSEVYLKSELVILGKKTLASASIFEDKIKKAECTLNISQQALTHGNKALKWEIRRSVYYILSHYYNKNLTWGILTGIRPSKIVQEMLYENKSEHEIKSILKSFYFISQPKIKLAYDVALTEKKILDSSKPTNISIYVGIPFCTSRCLYCSFASNSVKKYAKMVPLYTEALKKEIQAVASMVSSKGYSIESIYIGGGTPTAIDQRFLEEILYSISNNFNLSSLKEYTVEAGRPDTITKEKLLAIKNARVTRISINPQTMNDDVLQIIGRSHSSDETLKAYYLSRELGFTNINMDIIAGLPGDSLASFVDTLEKVIALSPENLTVHTFSVKRASIFNQEKDKYSLSKDAHQMVENAYSQAISAGMYPYYMYRQRNILGNLENVGYCQKGYESIYNVQIMEERQTILALGAGAISKIFYHGENRIERIFNVKSLEDYITRIDEMIERKKLATW